MRAKIFQISIFQNYKAIYQILIEQMFANIFRWAPPLYVLLCVCVSVCLSVRDKLQTSVPPLCGKCPSPFTLRCLSPLCGKCPSPLTLRCLSPPPLIINIFKYSVYPFQIDCMNNIVFVGWKNNAWEINLPYHIICMVTIFKPTAVEIITWWS